MKEDLRKRRYSFWISPRNKIELDKYLRFFNWDFQQFIFYMRLFVDEKKLFKHYIRKKALEGNGNPITLVRFLDKLKQKIEGKK